MNDDSIAKHMYCHVLSVLLTGQKKKKKKEHTSYSVGRGRARWLDASSSSDLALPKKSQNGEKLFNGLTPQLSTT